jgi:hypothetical protein
VPDNGVLHVQAKVREKNELWKQRAQMESAARKGDAGKAAKARARQAGLEAEAAAHADAAADMALFGMDGSDGDEEYDEQAAASDEEAAACAAATFVAC